MQDLSLLDMTLEVAHLRGIDFSCTLSRARVGVRVMDYLLHSTGPEESMRGSSINKGTCRSLYSLAVDAHSDNRDLDKDERVGKSSAGHLSDDAVVTVTAYFNDPRCCDLGERPR